MTTYTIVRKFIEELDSYYLNSLNDARRLGRHVNHDSRSRRYAFDITGLSFATTRHQRRISILDQGDLGSCTGNAGTGCLGTSPFWDEDAVKALVANTPLDENYAVGLYSDATKLDNYRGTYPPTDTGSDGLSIGKALRNRKLIAGFLHTFSFDDFRKALTVVPAITGVNWYDSMDQPDPDGIVRIGAWASVRGGHEFLITGIDEENQLVEADNSWGPNWGLNGSFKIPYLDFERLLHEQGDVTYFATNPVTPTPVPPIPLPSFTEDDLKAWVAMKVWAKAKGLPF